MSGRCEVWVWEGPLEVSQHCLLPESGAGRVQGWGPGKAVGRTWGVGWGRTSRQPQGSTTRGQEPPGPQASGPSSGVDREPCPLLTLGMGRVTARDVPTAQLCPGFSAFMAKWRMWTGIGCWVHSVQPSCSADWEGVVQLTL